MTAIHSLHSTHDELAHLYHLMGIDEESAKDESFMINRMREICEERAAQKIQIAVLTRDVERLMSYMEQLQHDIIAIEQSRAWRLGSRLMATLRSMLGRTPGRYAFIHIHRTLTVYHHWKKSR